MKCPHCNIGVNVEMKNSIWQTDNYDQTGMGYGIFYGHCPECYHLIVLFRLGKYTDHASIDFPYETLDGFTHEEVIYPKHATRAVEPEVPERYKKDFLEACAVLPLSPKASAALSRRILQDILRERFKIIHTSLATEIDQFIKLKDVPSYLSEAVDAVRNVGNFAAHPLKDTNTGEVVDVEPGEAEWLLEVIESLFDFAFVQPDRLEKKKKSLNLKLQTLGKPPMKP